MKTIFQKKTTTLFTTAFLIVSVCFFFSCKKNTVPENSPTVVQPVSPLQQNNTLEFINYRIDNVDTIYTVATDRMLYHGGDSLENNQFSPSIGVGAIHHYGTDSNFVLISFSKIGIALGSTQQLRMVLQTNYNPVGPSTLTPVYVNITEYGSIGQYISGNFNGQLIDRYGDPHTVSADFRILRAN